MDGATYRIAVPLLEERIAPRFDTAQRMLFVTISDERIASREIVRLIGIHPLQMAHWLKKEGVDVFICSAIDVITWQSMTNLGVTVYSRIAGDAVGAVEAFIRGTLDEMSIPCMGRGVGCKRRRWRGTEDKNNP
jgi:predicted Fe-Mo cluster-binding NifX family protein